MKTKHFLFGQWPAICLVFGTSLVFGTGSARALGGDKLQPTNLDSRMGNGSAEQMDGETAGGALHLSKTMLPSMDPRTAYEVSCRKLAKQSGSKSEDERLKEIFDFQWKYIMTTYPEFASWVGYPGQNHRWTDISLEAIALRKRELECPLIMIKGINRSKLKKSDQLAYDLFKRQAEEELEAARFPGDYLAVDQLGGVHQDVARMFAMMSRESEKDYSDLMARLKSTARVVESTQILLQKGLEAKVTQPKVVLRDVPGQVDAMIPVDPLASPLLMPFKEFPSTFNSGKASVLRSEAVKVFEAEIRPAFQKYRKFLTEVYIPNARESVSWKDLPNGEAWYAFKARQSTTTTLQPEQIHDIGQKEVKRIRGEMEKLIKDVSFKGDMQAFAKFLQTDKQFYFSNAEDLLRTYRDIAKRADPELIKLFGKLPRLPYGVKAVPEYAQKSQPAAYYESGSVEAGRAGYFFANTYDLPSRPKWEMQALTLHEAVPGHHLQIALAQEVESGPEFRKHQDFTAFTEGWGLYAESLGYEMGFYKDPFSRYGQLSMEMWRALRLVVDTGLHHLGWSRQQAIDFMKQNIPKPEHDIVVEVDRYIVWGGQALAYKIGQLKLRELRERSTRELGTNFDVRQFHDLVLGSGAVPLDVLERRVEEWISSKKRHLAASR